MTRRAKLKPAPTDAAGRAVAILEPSVRVFATWTPALIRSAELAADGGNLRLAADLCETLRADDRIRGVLSTRSRGLLGLPVEFEAAGDRRRSKRAVKALEADEDFAAAYPEAELVKLLEWGILLGVGAGPQTWIERPNGRLVGRLATWHARNLRFDWNARRWFVTLDGGTEAPIVEGDPAWLLYAPYGGSRPWAEGLWRALARWTLLKLYAITDWARHSEVHGSPIRVGVSPERGSTAEHRRELASDLRTLGRDTGMALPPGYDLKLVEATARTWEMFRAQIEMADTAIAVLLVGQNLTTEVKGGSYAAATVHSTVKTDLLRFDASSLATCLHDGGLVHWAEYNFGDAGLAPWPCYDVDPPEDAAQKAATRKTQGEALTALKAVGVDIAPVAEEFGLVMLPAAAAPASTTPKNPPPAETAAP